MIYKIIAARSSVRHRKESRLLAIMYLSAVFGLLLLIRPISAITGYKGEPRSYNLVMTTPQKGATVDVSKGLRDKTEVPDQIEADLSVSGLKRTRLSLKRQRFLTVPSMTEMSPDGIATKTKKLENEDVYFYMSEEGSGSFACELNRNMDSGLYVCQMSALISVGNMSCYIEFGTEKADCTIKQSGERRVYNERADFGRSVSKSDAPTHETIAMNGNKTSFELPEPGYKVVEVAMLVDRKFMEIFYERNPDKPAAAKREVAVYMALLASEMNVFYDSIREATGGEFVVFVYPTTVIYPNTGANFDWSEFHVIGGTRLDATKTMDDRLFAHVRRILRDWETDHVMAFTGYDIYDGSSNLLGYAYRSTVCSSSQLKYSLVEFREVDPSATCAHELGHALGVQHDDDLGCAGGTYVMSQKAFAITTRTKDTYYQFSPCSINAMKRYLNLRSECVTNNGFTDEQFQEVFCGGFLGSQDDTLDQQCQRRTNYAGSKACEKVTNEDSGCHSPSLIRCQSQSGICSTTLRHVWNGTPCGTSGNKVCFKGKCVENLDICPVEIPDAPCQCCGYKRNKRRLRCCRLGRRRQNKMDCYCCGELEDIEPPEGFDGPRY